MMNLKFFITDVFGKDKYSGNQLATFFDFGTLSTEEMQKMAKEINFSETTFITSKTRENDGYNVRIFTPESEIGFAGHPTLGTAFIIKKYLDNTIQDRVILNYKVGQIPVDIENDILWMTQKQPEFGKNIDRTLLASVLQLNDAEIDDRFPSQEVTTGLPFTLVPVRSLSALKKAKVNHAVYEKFCTITPAKGIMIFCTEVYEKNHQLSTRVFVDYLGIPEDPATGSATGCLAAYLLKNNVMNSSEIELTLGQGYEIGRPSELFIHASVKKDQFTIKVGGKVIEIAEGNWKTNE